MPRLRDSVEVLWPVQTVSAALAEGRQADWSQAPARVVGEPAAVQPAPPVSRQERPEVQLPRWTVWLHPGADIAQVCRIRWRGTAYVILGEIQTWSAGSQDRYLQLDIVPTPTFDQTRRERTMTARIALRHPTASADLTLDPTTLRYVDPALAYVTVPCRVTALTAAPEEADAGETVHLVVGYTVGIPLSVTAVRVGDRGVLSDTGDPLLDGRDLRVDEIVLGSDIAERVLRCSLDD